MEDVPDPQGTEFDWFALDDAGDVAVFATAGFGSVPAQVRTASGDHDAIGDRVAVTGWGTPSVWESYASMGFFAYDWDDQHRCYSRVGQPSQPISEELSVRLAATALPRLALSFRNNACISADDAWL